MTAAEMTEAEKINAELTRQRNLAAAGGLLAGYHASADGVAPLAAEADAVEAEAAKVDRVDAASVTHWASLLARVVDLRRSSELNRVNAESVAAQIVELGAPDPSKAG